MAITQQTADNLITIINNGVFLKHYNPRSSEVQRWREYYVLKEEFEDAELEIELSQWCQNGEMPIPRYEVTYSCEAKPEGVKGEAEGDDWACAYLAIQNEHDARVISAIERRIRQEDGVKHETYTEKADRDATREEEVKDAEILDKVLGNFVTQGEGTAEGQTV